MNFFKNIIILFTLISFFSCAPTTIEKKQPIEKVPEKIEEIEIIDEKVEETKKLESIKKPTKPEDKLINYNDIEKIIVFLSEDEILTSLFYEVFLKEIENFSIKLFCCVSIINFFCKHWNKRYIQCSFGKYSSKYVRKLNRNKESISNPTCTKTCSN